MTMNYFDFKAADRQYYRGRLGAVYSRRRTIFRVWQPFAESAVLRLYDADGKCFFAAPMERSGGIFEYERRGDLDGVWYDYLITRNGETVTSADPYSALVTADGERGQVVDMRRHAPEGWENVRGIAHECPIIYELSVRDFSMDEGAGFVNRGKLAAFAETGVCNSRGDTVGLDYIKYLGATHIQLMPIFDFDLDGGTYNWGYNPRFFNAPAAYYSQRDGVYELRRLVMAAHERGLGVIFDVVYNHVFSAEDSAFGRIFPRYYFRGKDGCSNGYSNGSGCGNEFASECKTARKFILDSLEFIAREYKADGFRFDLMGLLDLRTLREAERRLRRVNPDILLYGEGWTGGASPYPERYRGVLRNARELPRFAFFNDAFRDGVKGSVFCAEDCGYVNGAPDNGHLEPIAAALTGKFPESFWTSSAAQTINYVECHDNLTLFDKLNITLGEAERIEKADKMAAALIMLSRGIAFIQAGQELLRTKNGDGNSYRAPDSVNSLKWNSLSENRSIAEYYRGLAAFRRRFGGIAERKLEPLGGGFIMTFGDFLFIVDPTDKELTVKRRGDFEVYADGERASDTPCTRCARAAAFAARNIRYYL